MSTIISVPKDSLSLGLVRRVYGPHHSTPTGDAKIKQGSYFIPTWDEVAPTEENTLSKDDQDLLDLEVTSQIEIILNSLLLEKAQKDSSFFRPTPAEDIKDMRKDKQLLSWFVDTLDLQDKTIKAIFKDKKAAKLFFDTKGRMSEILDKEVTPLKEMKDAAKADLGGLVQRFNTFLETPQFKNLGKQEKDLMWAVYKKQLNNKKDIHNIAKEKLNKTWEEYFSLKAIKEASPINKLWNYYGSLCEHRNKLLGPNGENKWLWGEFFTLKNTEMNPYWSVSDPKEFDDQEHLKADKTKTMECLKSSHLSAMWREGNRFAYTNERTKKTRATWKKVLSPRMEKMVDTVLSHGTPWDNK